MRSIILLAPLLPWVLATPEPATAARKACLIRNGVGKGCKAPSHCVYNPGASSTSGSYLGYCQKPECGSRGLPGCKDGFNCVAFPDASCGPEADCGGYCVKAPPSYKPPTKSISTKTKTKTKTTTSTASTSLATPISCGGFRPNPPVCPSGQICKIPPSSICFDGQVADCAGICVGQPCGGFLINHPNPPCPQGQTCARRPSQPPADQVTDLPGICVFEDLTCGTKGSRVSKCPSGWGCVDDEGDSCYPDRGAKDCQGLCSFNTTTHGDAGGDGPQLSDV